MKVDPIPTPQMTDFAIGSDQQRGRLLLAVRAKSSLGAVYTQKAQMWMGPEQARALVRDLRLALKDLEG